MIHIVIGDSAAGSIKLALRDTLDSYIALPPNFGEGLVKDLLTMEGLSNRIEWFTKNYQCDWSFYGDMSRMALDAIYEVTEEEVTIWTANNASEQFGLAIVCFLLQDKHCKIYEMNLTDNIAKLTQGQTIRHTGEVIAEQMKKMLLLDMKKQLTKAEVTKLARQAEQLMAGDSVLRRWQDGQIVELEETFYDELILKYAFNYQQKVGQEYFKAIRLIGEIFGQEESILSDAWIDYRIRTLVAEGKLEAIGNLKEIQMYDIRVVSK